MKPIKFILPTLLLFSSLAGCGNQAPAAITSPVLNSIAITHNPNKTVYSLNEELDLTGLEVTAYYSDESHSVVTGYTTSGFDSSEVKEKCDVTVTYLNKTTSFTVQIKDLRRTYTLSYVNPLGHELVGVDVDKSTLPTSKKETEQVTVKISILDEYEYLGFELASGYPQEFYDQFKDYPQLTTEFTFVMPSFNVQFKFDIQLRSTKFKVNFATVEHINFYNVSETQLDAGETFIFNIALEPHYAISGTPFIVGDDSITVTEINNNAYSFTMPNKNVTVSATVNEVVVTYYTITFMEVEHLQFSNVNVTDLTKVEAYTTIRFKATVEADYEILQSPYVVGDTSIVITAEANDWYTFVMPDKNISISASTKGIVEQTYAVNYIVYDTNEDMERPEAIGSYSMLPTNITKGSLVEVYIEIIDEYYYTGFELVGDDYDSELLEEFDQYLKNESYFTFHMPAQDVTIKFNIMPQEEPEE